MVNPPAAPAKTGSNPPTAASTDASAETIRRFLRSACRRGRAGFFGRAAVDATLLSAALLLVAAVVAAITLRGDWAGIGLRISATGAFVGLGLVAWLAGRRAYGSLARTARTIASVDAPLSKDPPPGRHRAERLLRHEIRAAHEFAEELEAAAERRGPRPLRSDSLARGYIADVAARASAPGIHPRWACPRGSRRPRLYAAAVLAVLLGIAFWWPPLAGGLSLVLAAEDGHPPTPPEPVWSSLALELDYPDHTGRPNRALPNPSGALRVPAGTVVRLDLVGRHRSRAGRVVLNHAGSELADPPPPQVIQLAAEGDDGMQWTGSFTVRGAGSWTLVLLDDELDDPEVLGDDVGRRSAALPIELEPDRPPEIELAPLAADQREVREDDQVDVRFVARDDFGLASAELVYQLPDGTSHRLPIPGPTRTKRLWRHRYTWDISQIPIAERSEVLYWIEVRDNDPGLGLQPLPDPPGKLTRSATMRLVVRDDEAEHAANIASLAAIRDHAVDLLAIRMTTGAFDGTSPGAAPASLLVRAAQARDILRRSAELLAMLAKAIDDLSVDALAHERDVGTLTEIHGRLMELHRDELEGHSRMPPESEITDPPSVVRALARLDRHNGREITQLEDEIIRLDDLVDGQIIERLEGLVARLEATQQKLVELLEQLKAGDESVRAQISQLEQRRREDLRRIAEARAMLRKEVDEEFMNMDAFAVLERMAQHEQLGAMLERGEVDEALEQAKGQLGEVQQLRDQVQQRAGSVGQESSLSEEDRKRMQLLRELSLLQDEQKNLEAQTRRLHETWRESVSGEEAGDDSRQQARDAARDLAEALEGINDARLGREGRRGLEDAKTALEKLEDLAQSGDAKALELAEAAREAASALERASEGSESKEAEGRAVERARGKASRLSQKLGEALPPPSDVLDDEGRARASELAERQEGLQKRTRDLMDQDIADLLPAPGRKALEQAKRGMQGSGEALGQPRPQQALQGEQQALRGIQEAIDSLRRGSPPPPSGASRGEASTEAERDRSLRDELMDAMREGVPEGFGEPVKRYYEELLR